MAEYRQASSIQQLTPHMSVTARTGPSQSQEPGVSSGFPMCLIGALVLEPSSANFLPESWIGNKESRSQIRHHKQEFNCLCCDVLPPDLLMSSFMLSRIMQVGGTEKENNAIYQKEIMYSVLFMSPSGKPCGLNQMDSD